MELDAPFNATCDAPHKLQSSRKLANLDPLLEWLRLVPGRVALAHLALLAGIMLTGHATVPEQAEFPDPGLAAAVRGALGLGDSDPLPHSVLRHVRHLQATDRGIRSLDGLDQLTELESIQLVSNPLDSIVIPATLTKLTTLIAWDCMITNLVFLAGTASLEALTLVETKLSELVLPGTYPKLRLIQVSGTRSRNSLFPRSYRRLRNSTFINAVWIRSISRGLLCPNWNGSILQTLKLPCSGSMTGQTGSSGSRCGTTS